MLFCLIGHSSSGKSTIERELNEKGYERLISYTTRRPRKNEINGLDYHYITEEEFNELKSEGFFHEVAKYRDWFYGISLDGVNLEEEDYIAVVTVHGYEELSKHTDKIIAIHIKVEERERIIRQLMRGDEVDEVIRRIHTDREDFKGVETISHYIVRNNDLEMSVNVVEKIIKKHSETSKNM